MITPDDQAIQELAKRIGEEYRPERIILFGSRAYGEPHEYSDVDLLVIMDFEGGGLRKSLEVLEHVDPSFSVDLLVRRPRDTAERYQLGDPLIREALDRGVVLYERPRAA